MAEELNISTGSKSEQYETLLIQLESLFRGENDAIANMANMAAALKAQFGFLWVGFYRVKDDHLILGPFQGPIACTRIAWGKGVCGSAWKEARTLIVPDVDAFPGHIACSSLSRSEIVIPILKKERVLAVLDIDSEQLAAFDDTDAYWLEKIVSLIDIKKS